MDLLKNEWCIVPKMEYDFEDEAEATKVLENAFVEHDLLASALEEEFENTFTSPEKDETPTSQFSYDLQGDVLEEEEYDFLSDDSCEGKSSKCWDDEDEKREITTQENAFTLNLTESGDNDNMLGDDMIMNFFAGEENINNAGLQILREENLSETNKDSTLIPYSDKHNILKHEKANLLSNTLSSQISVDYVDNHNENSFCHIEEEFLNTEKEIHDVKEFVIEYPLNEIYEDNSSNISGDCVQLQNVENYSNTGKTENSISHPENADIKEDSSQSFTECEDTSLDVNSCFQTLITDQKDSYLHQEEDDLIILPLFETHKLTKLKVESSITDNTTENSISDSWNLVENDRVENMGEEKEYNLTRNVDFGKNTENGFQFVSRAKRKGKKGKGFPLSNVSSKFSAPVDRHDFDAVQVPNHFDLPLGNYFSMLSAQGVEQQ